MAELCLLSFRDELEDAHKDICDRFINEFSNIDQDITRLLNIIRNSVRPEKIIDSNYHAEASKILRNHFNFTSNILHLAKYKREGNKFILKRIEF